MMSARLRTFAGLAVGVVPCAIVVHLFAEAVSVGRDAFGAAFFIRHIYLGLLLFATAIWFGRTVGVGANVAERRRRCALIAAQLRAGSLRASLSTLALGNVAFFALSQLVEGVPMASGDWCAGLVAAIAGSLLAALVVHICGRSIVLAALCAITIVMRAGTKRCVNTPAQRWIAPRHAARAFSLFVPNRPPPALFLV